MKLISSLLLLIPALVSASNNERELQTIPDWHVTLLTVDTQSFTFETGLGGGDNVNVKIAVLDKCRMESATRTTVGDFYPGTGSVDGINVDNTGVAGPGAGNAVSFSFAEGISDNTLIYASDGPTAENAVVNFCVLTGLYDGTMLIDFAEVKLTYNINLVTQIPELTGYTVTQAEEFNDADDTDIEFDGTVLAYFCDPDTKEILTNDGTKTNQGSILNVCFKVDEGQFEVQDIMEFTVKNALGEAPSQQIITGSESASALYSTKNCFDEGANDKNVCVVSFLLKADFYDFAALTLTGEGSVLLEFGSSGARRRLRRKLQVDPVEETFQVTAQEFAVDQVNQPAGSSASSAMTSMAAFGAIVGAALVL
jgi:hypothetical protein